MHFSSVLSRKFNQPLARDAKMTDVPSHCWVLPTLLNHAGVEFLHLGCNEASSSPQVPPLFWWEGPDGSRVLTMYSGEHTWGCNMMDLPAQGYRTYVPVASAAPDKGLLSVANDGRSMENDALKLES
jgi:alpha-mannosidase